MLLIISLINKTNNIEEQVVPSNTSYHYNWQLEKEDGTIVLKKSDISKNTRLVSYIYNGEEKLSKLVNEFSFMLDSVFISTKNSFYLEQKDNDIYLFINNDYIFKATDFEHYDNKDSKLNIPVNTYMNINKNQKIQPKETLVIKIPSPYKNDSNKFYMMKFTINKILDINL